jgi:hypothetical protein
LLLEREIGFICLLIFLNAWNQFRPLLGERGLLPVRDFIQRVTFSEALSLFYRFPQERAFAIAAASGIVLVVVVLTGVASRTTVGAAPTGLSIYCISPRFCDV